MNTQQFSEALQSKKKKTVWIICFIAAVCVCVMLVIGAVAVLNGATRKPNPKMVQVANPIIEVSSAAEMSEYLDFSVPVRQKDVETYSVIVTDNYPTIGQIDYADGSEYRIQYGSGDISGIYGGVLADTRDVGNVKVSYYTCLSDDSEVTYAIWEEGGYTFSYVYTGDGRDEVRTLIEKFKETC